MLASHCLRCFGYGIRRRSSRGTRARASVMSRTCAAPPAGLKRRALCRRRLLRSDERVDAPFRLDRGAGRATRASPLAPGRSTSVPANVASA
jgi:hypothetical protein